MVAIYGAMEEWREDHDKPVVDDKVTSSLIQQAHPPANEPLSPSTSPPLPPFPLPDIAEEKSLRESTKTRPTRAPSLAPASQSLSRRPFLKTKVVHVSQDAPAVPEVPPHLIASVQPPPFSAILIFDPPSVKVDPSMTILTLETCTTG